MLTVTITKPEGGKTPQDLSNDLVTLAQEGSSALASVGIQSVNGVAVSSACEVLFGDATKKLYANCCRRPIADGGANFRLFWTLRGSSLEIAASAKTPGWIAVGFAKSPGKMVGR